MCGGPDNMDCCSECFEDEARVPEFCVEVWDARGDGTRDVSCELRFGHLGQHVAEGWDEERLASIPPRRHLTRWKIEWSTETQTAEIVWPQDKER